MKKVGELKLYTLEEVLDEQIGKVGNPARDEHERRVEEAVYTYHFGEATGHRARKCGGRQPRSTIQMGCCASAARIPLTVVATVNGHGLEAHIKK